MTLWTASWPLSIGQNRRNRASRGLYRPTDWPQRLIRWLIGLSRRFSALSGQPAALSGGSVLTLCSPQLAREVPQVEPRHLVLQRAQRDAQIAGRSGDVPVRFFERSKNEVSLERIAGFLEQRLAGGRRRVEPRKVVLERKILVCDPILVADRDQAFDQVLQLADVSRPPVRLQDLQRRVGDTAHRLPELAAVPLQEQSCQLRQVVDALPKRGHPDRDDVDPVIEVFAEAAVLHRLVEVDIG